MKWLQLVCSVLSEQLEELKGRDRTTTLAPDGLVEWSLVAPFVDQYQNYSGLTTAQQAARVFAALLSQSGQQRLVCDARSQ